MQTSTRFGVSYPVAARTDPADVAVHIGNVVTGLERAVRYDSGTFAARPTSSVGTPGITGRHYFATDENQMYFDYGTGWIGIMVQNQKQISTLNATAAASGYASYITGDTQPRFVIGADGKHQWGAGGASALDPLATLYRSGAGMLSTDGTMIVNGSLYVSTTAHAIWVQNINPAFSVFLVKAASDTQQRLRILGDGMHQWGPGGTTPEDVNLYRLGVDALATDDRFVVAGAQVAGQSFGVQVGPTNSLAMHFQGYIGGGANAYIGHNSWFGSDGLFRWDGTHASFGTRGIFFNYSGASNGIAFYADNAAATSGTAFVPAPRMLVRNDGDIQVVNKLLLGPAGDANLYRSAANVLRTPGSLIVDGNVDVAGTLTGGGAVPTGAMMQYAGAAAPTGWLLADGAAVSRTTYAALFTAIGTQYGVGDGSTTFNLPNLKGRVAVGLDAANAKFDVRGETGGAETVALSVAELAAHAHGVTDPTHNHSLNNPTHNHGTNGTALGGTNPNAPGQAGVMGSNEIPFSIPVSLGVSAAATAVSANAVGTGVSIQNNGSGTAHNNLPPYIALNYIIKT